MAIDRPDFDGLNEADLQSLVEAGAAEGHRLEYKREPYGAGDDAKREFLKDLSSFANSFGGHLIIGIEEKDGSAAELVGFAAADLDEIKQRLESLARDAIEPRIVGIRIKGVPLSGGGAALVLRVPQSWNPAHRVNLKGLNKYFVRNSSGAHEASVEELRNLFTKAASFEDRVLSFREQRVVEIVAGKGAIPLRGAGRLIVHLVPLSAFGVGTSVDLNTVHEAQGSFAPFGSGGWTPRFNLHGFANTRDDEDHPSYTQIFRNGIVEAAIGNILRDRDGKGFLPSGVTPRYLLEQVPTYVTSMTKIGLSAPIIILTAFEGLSGAFLWVNERYYPSRLVQSFPLTNPMLMPDVILSDLVSKERDRSLLRPILDALWNAAGYAKCFDMADDGTWRSQ